MTQKNIIITGAGGLIGPLVAQRLLADPSYRVVLTDLFDPKVPAGVAHPENAVCMKGDICDPAFVKSLLDAGQEGTGKLDAIFVFHGIMSAGSEANYDLSLKVNVASVRDLLLAIRARTSTQADNGGSKVRVIYSSSQAVFGQPLPEKITDSVTPTPEGTYGAHKFLTEIFLNDMHRKGFVDAFTVRFPTLVVRPGAPSNAASSFLSGMIREPMKDEECVIPLKDRKFRTFICSLSSTQENLIRVLNMDSDALPPHQRHINFPGISATVQELMDGLAKYGGEEKLKLLKEETMPELERILRSWPQDFDMSTPDRLGLIRDQKPEDLVKEYVDSLKQ